MVEVRPPFIFLRANHVPQSSTLLEGTGKKNLYLRSLTKILTTSQTIQFGTSLETALFTSTEKTPVTLYLIATLMGTLQYSWRHQFISVV